MIDKFNNKLTQSKELNIFSNQAVHNVFEDNLELAYKKSNSLLCRNEECLCLNSEIVKRKNDLMNLLQKHKLMGSIKSEEFSEKTNEIEIIDEEVKELETKIKAYEGTGLGNLDFYQLNEVEQNLLNLLIKSKEKKLILQEELMNDPLEEYNNNLKCKVCQNNESNVVLRPCNHLCMCLECVYSTIKCPECVEDIDFYDKVYMQD